MVFPCVFFGLMWSNRGLLEFPNRYRSRNSSVWSVMNISSGVSTQASINFTEFHFCHNAEICGGFGVAKPRKNCPATLTGYVIAPCMT